MKKSERKKIRFSRKRIAATSVLFVLTAAVYSSYAFVPPEYRYIRQLVIVVGSLLSVITLVSFAKLFTGEIRRELYRRISEAMFNVGEKWRSFKAAVRKRLGLPEKPDDRSRDVRHIVFDSDDRRRSRVSRIEKLKYSAMENDRRRIRFLWAKYVVENTAKEDPPSIADTPNEISGKITAHQPNTELFELYHTARYAGDGAKIDPQAVIRQANVVGTKGKI